MSVYNAYMTLSGAVDADVRRDERLSLRTSYRIGGPAALLVAVHSYAALVKTVEVLHAEHVDWVIVGKGSNLLVSDAGYSGCVIVLDGEFSRIEVYRDDALITAGAGALLSRTVQAAQKAGLSGLECCVGVPGTVGGAVSMDAGSRREWIGRRVRDLVAYIPGQGMRRFGSSEVEWGYRTTSLPTNAIILEATFLLLPADPAAIAQDMEARLRRRRGSQPLGRPSCGSVFRNPPDHSVGQMVEALGLKGYAVGGAMVSQEHGNFIVNRGGASAADVVAVMRRIHDDVLARFGVDLTPEVKLLGFGA